MLLLSPTKHLSIYSVSFALEKLFAFIVILKDEFVAENRRKLWRKIKEKTYDRIKLLTKETRQGFRGNDGAQLFFHKYSEKNVFLLDGKVVQIFLEKLANIGYQQNVFAVLVDKQLLKSKQTAWYLFKMDKKCKYSFRVKLKANESNYHASFDPKLASQDLR